jgi:hypothetical protein
VSTEVKDFIPPPDPDDPRTPMERMESFARRLFAVPKSEIDALRAKEQAAKEQGKRAAS